MNALTEAHLLSPYRLPTSYPVTLGADEATAWLVGWFTLWHPAVLLRLSRPPMASSSYDHDQPGAGFIYALPVGPHLYQPDDWPHRVQEANGLQFEADLSLSSTLEALRQACTTLGESIAHTEVDKLLELPSEATRPFAALGYGYLIVESLFDAADHEHLLDQEAFWADVTQAAQQLRDGADPRPTLQAAATKLQYAREALCMNGFTFMDWIQIPATANNTSLPESFVWPSSFKRGFPFTIITPGQTWEQLPQEQPERFAELKAHVPEGLPARLELALGGYRERDDSYLPLESQCWNYAKGQQVAKACFGPDVPIVFGRKKSNGFPSLPTWLRHCGYERAIFANFDGSLTPTRNQAVLNWPAPDGRTIDGTAKEAQPADDSLTFFNIIYTLHQATTQDSYPLLPLLHRGEQPAVGYEELLELCDLAPALGSFQSVSRYLEEHTYGDYLGSTTVDDYLQDALDDRTTTQKRPDAVSGFAQHHRLRRRLDAAFALASLQRVLSAPGNDDVHLHEQLLACETDIETAGADCPTLPATLPGIETAIAERLAARLQARAEENKPGYLLFNPCAYTRRVGVELFGCPGPIPPGDAVKASQFDGGVARLTVEVPALGFAWIPEGNPTLPLAKPKLKTADGTVVRNEFFEAEIDVATGGLRSFRDARTRLNRLGMMPIYHPGSTCRATEIRVTSAGAALGEITAQGELLNDEGQVIAKFTHRIRAWQARPALEIQLTLEPLVPPSGYPWHAFFGARFGRRDERAVLFRGSHGKNSRSTSNRPCTSDYLEFRLAGERTFLFSGGLPFFQVHSNRMVDAVLIPEGETARQFEFLIAADREHPMQTAQGWTTPTPIVRTRKGPPNGLTSSWLGHLDLPSLLMLNLRPEGTGRAATARFVETASYAGCAELRFAIPPASASKIDAYGELCEPLSLNEGAIPLEFSADEGFRLRIDW